MNFDEIEKILEKELPNKFLTLSSLSVYHANKLDKKIIITTNKKSFETYIENFYELISDVIATNSFEFSEHKYRHKNVSYLLPIAKLVLIELGFDIYRFTPPRSGWNEKSPQSFLENNLLIERHINITTEHETELVARKATFSKKILRKKKMSWLQLTTQQTESLQKKKLSFLAQETK